MDPITILQTVGAAAELSLVIIRSCQEIYKFTNEVRAIDKTLTRIEDEVSDLDRTLRMVALALDDNYVKRVAKAKLRTGADILGVVKTSVDRSQYTLGRLDAVLKVILGDPGDSTAMKALRQTVRSKRQHKELVECLDQIDRSKQSLGICLTTLSVYIVANLPRYRQPGGQDEIAPLTKQLEDVLLTPKNADDHRIRKTAATVLERVKSPPSPEPGLSRATTLLNEAVDEIEPSDDGESVNSRHEADWWTSLLETSGKSLATTRRASLSNLSGSPQSDSDPEFEETALIEPPNEKFQIDLIRDMIAEGNNNYDLRNYEQAAAQLEEALTTAEDLSKQAVTFLERDLTQVKLNISSIYISQEKYLDAAEKHLLQAVVDISTDKRSNDAELQQRLYMAYYFLARVYMLQGKYAESQSYGEEAMNGHMAAGENDRPYLDTLQLLILVYFAQGNNVRAQMLLKRLPEDRKEKVKRQMQTAHRPPQPATSRGPHSPSQSASRAANPPRSSGLGVNTAPNSPQPNNPRKHSTSGPFSPVGGIFPPTGSATPFTGASSVNSKASAENTRPFLHRAPSETRDPTRESFSEIRELEQAGFKDDFDEDEALAWAIRHDNQRIVRALVSNPGILITRKRHFGRSSEVFKLANINGSRKKAMRDTQPLMLATRIPGRVMIARMLLELGASKSIRDDKNRSLLEVAAMNGQQEIISVLIDYGVTIHCEDGIKAFHLAAQHNQLEVLALFLRHEMDPDTVDPDYGRTALNWAALSNHEKAVEYLISNGADQNMHDRRGSTALMGAVRQGYQGMTTLLLRFFADVNRANDRGQTALMIASEQARPWAVRLILDEPHVDLDLKDHNGWTALMWACNRRQLEIVALILEHGYAGINHTCFRGSRALDHAKGSKPLMDLLRQYKAEPGTGIARRGTVDETYKGYVLI